MTRSYEINPYQGEFWNGWHLRCIKDGAVVGGGSFPVVEGFDTPEEANQLAYTEAVIFAGRWLEIDKGLTP